ncbi:hypothetical protein H8B13_19650 [Hymenobacter sp. BT188]|nr:hypothetical protein [Hymenobacter sp. BT188]
MQTLLALLLFEAPTMPITDATFLGLPFSAQAQVVWQEDTYLTTRYEEEDTE